MNDKIKKDLKTKFGAKETKKSKINDKKVLDYLDANQTDIFRLSDIRAQCGVSGGSLYSTVYRLASQEKIGFAAAKYHIFMHSSNEKIRSFTGQNVTKILIWHKNYKACAPLRDEWIDEEPSQRGQIPLFTTELESMSNDELVDLIDKAKKIQIQRGIAKRYSCLVDGIQEQLVDVFESIGITDPVYYAHSDDTISLLTYTAVPNMPIDIVVDAGDGPKRLNCKHLTIFGKKIVQVTDSMFGSE